MKNLLCTYPRSGSRYIAGFLVANTDLNFERSHSAKDCIEYENIVSTVRNPLDCFASQITLEIEFQNILGENDINNHIKNENKKIDLEKSFAHCSEMYKNFYSDLLKFNPFIFDFNKLRNKESLLKEIKNMQLIINFNINNEIREDFNVIGTTAKINKEIFLSAKKSDTYKKVYDFLKEKDLSESIDIYNNILLNRN